MASELLPRGVVTRGNQFRDIAGRSFSISTRSASFFRMYIGVVLIANTVGRADLLTYFYSSRGVFPGTVVGFQNPSWTWPVLFAVLIFLAGAYTIGYHARFTAIWIWILLLLVHQRNPLVLQAGDYLLRYSILFSAFFPLDRHYSVRNIYRSNGEYRPTDVVTIGTIGITIQVAIMYYRNLAHKSTGDMWHEGNALLHIYHLEPLTNSVGELMASYPLLLTVATYAWVTLLALCVLLFVQTRVQPLVNTAFIVGHILILMTLNIGLFAWVAIGVHLLFYRERAINWANSQLAKMGVIQTVPSLKPHIEQLDFSILQYIDSVYRDEKLTTLKKRGAAIVGVVLILLTVASTAAGFGVAVPQPIEDTTDATLNIQYWSMFAPDPPEDYAWFVPAVQLANGSQIDPTTGKPPNFARPERVESEYPTPQHHAYHKRVRGSASDPTRMHLAKYYCRQVSEHGRTPTNATLNYVVVEPNVVNGTPRQTRQSFGTYDC